MKFSINSYIAWFNDKLRFKAFFECRTYMAKSINTQKTSKKTVLGYE